MFPQLPALALLSSSDQEAVFFLLHGFKPRPGCMSHHCALWVQSAGSLNCPPNPALSEPPLCLSFLIKGPRKERRAGQPMEFSL